MNDVPTNFINCHAIYGVAMFERIKTGFSLIPNKFWLKPYTLKSLSPRLKSRARSNLFACFTRIDSIKNAMSFVNSSI